MSEISDQRSHLHRWKAHLTTDQRLSELVKAKKAENGSRWGKAADELMGEAIAKMRQLIQTCNDPSHIRAVAGVIKIVGELQLGFMVLQDDPLERSLQGRLNDE